MGGKLSKQPDVAKAKVAKKTAEVNDKDKAILELKGSRDRMKKYKKKV